MCIVADNLEQVGQFYSLIVIAVVIVNVKKSLITVHDS